MTCNVNDGFHFFLVIIGINTNKIKVIDVNMKDYKYLDESGQISAEMILLIGALLIIVIVAGGYIFGITQSIGSNITEVIETARDSTIGRM